MPNNPDVKNSSILVTQYIARQPIFHADRSIFAFELLYRDSVNNAFPAGTTDGQATGRLFFNALMLVGVEKLALNQTVFINLSSEGLLEDLPTLLQPENTVIEIVERTENIELVVERVIELKKAGYVFALDDYDSHEKWQPLLSRPDLETARI